MVDRTKDARYILRHLRRAEHELHLVSDHGNPALKDNVRHVVALLTPLIQEAEAILEQIRLEDDG